MKLKILLITIGLGVLFGAFKTYEYVKEDRKRVKSNYENLLKEREDAYAKKLDSINGVSQTKFVEYTFKKDKELLDYLNSSNNQLKGLEKMLDEANIKIKRLTDITSTVYRARDTIVSTISLDSLAQKINTLSEFSIPVLDKTDCFEIEGSFNFKDSKAQLNITNRKFTDTITTVDYWSRKKHRWVLGLKTGLFGKKILHRKEQSKCLVNVKTIVIHKKG